jgi:non-specific serine/threonine protein kinase
VELLGRLRLVPEGSARLTSGELTRFRTRKVALLLAHLAYHLDRPRSRESLIDLLWPGGDATTGRRSLSTALYSLRRILEPRGVGEGAVLIAGRETVRLNPDAVRTDVAEFEALMGPAAGLSDACRARSLVQATDLYHGELLPGYYEEWVLRERERLADQYVRGLAELAALHERAGDRRRACDTARRAVEADPLREESWRELIRLLASIGEATEARRLYREMERLLESEMGVSPGAATRALLASLDDGATVRPCVPPAPSRPGPPLRGGAPPPLRTGTVTLLLAEVRAAGAEQGMTGRPYPYEPLRQLLQAHGGVALPAAEAPVAALFGAASDALAGACALRQAAPAPMRIALHTTEARPTAPLLEGPGYRYGVRLLAAAPEGHLLVSWRTAALLEETLPDTLRLVDLGRYRLQADATAERLFTVEERQAPARARAVPEALPAYTGRLPLTLTRFFGREGEMERLAKLLADPSAGPRLVTLTGPGGSGKSRLALEVARRLLPAWRGAVWFVPLADLDDPAGIVPAVRDAIGLPRSPDADPLEQIAAALAGQPSLLLLDNAEHLVPAGTARVWSLLERVASLTCLLTSRRSLGLQGEREEAVQPLPTPEGADDPDALLTNPSVRLFVDRAQSVRSDFQVTAGSAAAVAALCRRLEGIPLAIELAAARAQVLTPGQMLAQLDQRLDWPARRHGAGAPHHQTLRAALEWSYRLLPPELQQIFRGLSVFRGGWTGEAAGAVCLADGPDGSTALMPMLGCLEHLRTCSLILAEAPAPPASVDDRPSTVPGLRFRMLETLREYGGAQLAPEERERLQKRHAAFFLRLAREAEGRLHGPEQVEWLDHLDQEHENLQAALAGSLTQPEGDLGLRLAGALVWFWHLRGHLAEGRRWLETLLAREPAPTPSSRAEDSIARATALHGAGQLAFYQGDHATARTYFEASVALWRAIGDRRGLASALIYTGIAAGNRGDRCEALALLKESVALWRELAEPWGLGLALWAIGSSAVLGRFPEVDSAMAHALLTESRTLLRESGDPWALGAPLPFLAMLARRAGDRAAARACLEEMLRLAEQVRDPYRIFRAIGELTELALEEGEIPTARAFCRNALLLARQMGNPRSVAIALERWAMLAAAEREWPRAARLWSAMIRLRETAGAVLAPTDQAEVDRQIAPVRVALPESAFSAAWAEGEAMDGEQAVAYALESA